MQTQPTTITQKGQVTIPVEIRRLLRLRSGDKVKFVVTRKKEVKVKPAQRASIMHLYGSLKLKVKVPKFKNVEDLIRWESDSFERGVAEDDKRILKIYQKTK
ncbi:MAG: AbrB/MazE/SpoVT family DNA-binding domain-containing protein [Patescibacteria group bacterium]